MKVSRMETLAGLLVILVGLQSLFVLGFQDDVNLTQPNGEKTVDCVDAMAAEPQSQTSLSGISLLDTAVETASEGQIPAPAPLAVRRLSPLSYIGNNGVPSHVYPLAECEGDCDNDDECDSGLECFQRDGTETVPGCNGQGDSGIDYCIVKGTGDSGSSTPNPTPASASPGTLSTPGDNGSPSSAFPLQRCQGDCDGDGDCDTGLECWHRSGSQSVPGCSGSGQYGKDYCIDPSDKDSSPGTPNPTPTPPSSTPNPTPNTGSPGTLSNPGDNGSPSSAFPLQRCEGDCDGDGDCDTGLECWHRSGSQAVPGCSGSGVYGKDYCIDPADKGGTPSTPQPTPPTTPSPTPSGGTPALEYVGDNGSPSNKFPLGLCEGDCDHDNDCGSGLYCYQRSGTQAVPGCSGTGQSGKDYCVSDGSTPGTPQPTPSTTPSPTPSGGTPALEKVGDNGSPSDKFPLGLCQGDCDHDNDCGSGLYCYQRSGTQDVPGCSGSGESGKDYCVSDGSPSNPTPQPTPSPTINPGSGGQLTNPGDNNSPSSVFPLHKCQGDCDSDNDCGSGLKCFHRSGTEYVPGCSGTGVSGKDYCYDESEADNLPPTPNPTPVPPTGSNYRLRLYWEDGYYWQESYDEMFFCMVSSGDKVKIETCGNGNTRWEIVPLSGQGDQIRKNGSNQCIELIGSRAIALRGCDATVTRQRWMAVMGAFDQYRFDIRPVRDLSKCLTQHHHPKPGEDVFAEFCSTAHQHTTGYWNKY